MTARRRTGTRRAPRGAAGPRGVEVELKYRPTTIAAAERTLAADPLAGFAAGMPVETLRLEDRYLDTADAALARAGYALRLRTTSSGTIASIKSTASPAIRGDPHRREEIEGPADATAGPFDWPASEARSLVLDACGGAPLVELVAIRQLRRRRRLSDTRATIELSLDEVEVATGGGAGDRWLELEVELVRGDEGRLLDVAAALDAVGDLEPATESKLERALSAAEARRRP